MSQNPFLETMQGHQDKKLREIVESKRGDYQPEAVAAAEQVLKSRNIKFKELEPVEHIEMTYDEIKEDIRQRRARGESMPAIRAYYNSCGVDINDPNIKEYDTDVTRAANLITLRVISLSIGAAGALLGVMNESGDVATLRGIFGIIGGLGLIWFASTFRKK